MPPNFQRKIVTREQLLHACEQSRRAGQTIVHCHGCFDIVHPGHVRYLEFARRQGDLLLVSLTGDAHIDKGARRPYIPQELRAESLAALEFVDWVHIDPHSTAEALLNDVKPDIYVKGKEYERADDAKFLRERQVVEGNGGRVLFSSGDVVFSSTKLIDQLSDDAEAEQQRLAILCHRHQIDRSGLTQWLQRFAELRVLVVGDLVIDRYVFCDALDVANEAPMLALKRLEEQVYVGGAAIVARHLAALGAQAFLLTAAAHDEATALAERVLGQEGVECHFARCRPSLVEKTRYLVEDSKILKVETAERVPLDSLAQRRATAVLEQQARTADAAIFCDFGFGMLSESFLQRVLSPLRHRLRVITGDVSGPRANLLNLQGADLLTPTEREVRTTLNDYDRGLSAVAYDLLARTQAKHLFVTLEKKGLVVFDRCSDQPESPDWSARLLSEHLPSFTQRPVDRLGGGDALLATASLALAAGAPLMHAAYLGNAAAALHIGTLGNAPLPAASLRRWINQRGELHRHPPGNPPVSIRAIEQTIGV